MTEQILQMYVGWVDSMTFAQLNELLLAAKLQNPTNVTSLDVLRQFQDQLSQGTIGVQQIRGDAYISPLGGLIQLPVSFTVLGQRFVPDSWALAKMVYDDVIWDEDGILTEADKVVRRVPSALDVAFTVLANNQVVPDLVARITNTQGQRFRDGLPYQHNLAAARNVIDRQVAAAWNTNIYMNWLAALRTLSAPTTDAQFPECMRTRAWANKTLNTQLASWTQLRHDTVLYVKQSYTGMPICSYPYGFVEPVPSFWRQMKDMASKTATLIASSPFSGTCATPDGWGQVSCGEIQNRQFQFLRQFASTMSTLKSIAQKELDQQPLTPAESQFLQETVEITVSYGSVRQYNGWYPRLYYLEQGQGVSDTWDALVTDVHTDPPAPYQGDPGSILHEGVGAVHLLVAAIDNGPDRRVYVGPAFTHYEFEKPMNARMTDSEWKNQVENGQHPPPPEWTRSYSVPGNLTLNYGHP